MLRNPIFQRTNYGGQFRPLSGTTALSEVETKFHVETLQSVIGDSRYEKSKIVTVSFQKFGKEIVTKDTDAYYDDVISRMKAKTDFESRVSEYADGDKLSFFETLARWSFTILPRGKTSPIVPSDQIFAACEEAYALFSEVHLSTGCQKIPKIIKKFFRFAIDYI